MELKKWIVKAIVQKSISFLPYRNQVNFLFQKYISKGVKLTDNYFYDRLEHAKMHINAFRHYSNAPKPDNCLELGTGWYPVVPISFYLIGSHEIYSVDISKILTKSRLKTTIQKFIEADLNGELKKYIEYREDKLKELNVLFTELEKYTFEQCLEKLNLNYLIQDARSLSIQDNSIHLISSNNTFEHLSPGILKDILSEFKRVINKRSGIMSHSIDLSDHFAHSDKSISDYNFLQFSDKQWKWIDNKIQPLNRLRFDDYLQLYQQLNIPINKEMRVNGNINNLKSIRLAQKFMNKPLDILVIRACNFISDMRTESPLQDANTIK